MYGEKMEALSNFYGEGIELRNKGKGSPRNLESVCTFTELAS